jgi:sugar/nucleoside kinase (ribokinase family)
VSTKIIYLGVVTHDIVIFVDEMPARGGKFWAHAAEMVGGGMVANAAVAVA